MTHFGLGPAVLLCVAFVGAQVLLGIPLAIVGLMFGVPLGTHPLVLAGVNLAAFALTVGVAWMIYRPPLRQIWSLRPVPLTALVALITATVGAGIVYSEIDNTVRTILPVPAQMEDLFEGFARAAEQPLAGAVLLVVVAPVTEELLFRGVILSGLLGRFRASVAILVSAVLFMLVHLNPWQFAAAAGLGMITGWLYVRTRSLLPGLVVHVVQNGLVCLVPWLPFEVEGFSKTDVFAVPTHQPLWFSGLGLALLVVGLAVVWRQCPAVLPRQELLQTEETPPSPADSSDPVSLRKPLT